MLKKKIIFAFSYIISFRQYYYLVLLYRFNYFYQHYLILGLYFILQSQIWVNFEQQTSIYNFEEKLQGYSSMSVAKSQLNNSTAKACFSFSKAPRSPKPEKHNDAIYDLPPVSSNRSTFIGFGKKVQIGTKGFSPSPDKYEKPSDFDKSPKKGISFGISREDFKAISMFYQSKNPGPSEYNNTVKLPSKSFMIRGRDGFPKLIKQSTNPGPGQYDLKQQTDKNFYTDSKRKSPLVYTFKKGKQNNSPKGSNVGPTSYQTALASMGRQLLANNRTEKSFHFPKQSRETLELPKSKIGPGSYDHFSEFGK